MQSLLSTVAIGGIAFAVMIKATSLARPDVVVTTTRNEVETGEAWNPDDLVLSSGVRSVTKINELEWLITMDDGGHVVTTHPRHPFYSTLQRNV